MCCFFVSLGCPTVEWVLTGEEGSSAELWEHSPEGPECPRQAVGSTTLDLKLGHTACQVLWVRRKPENYSLGCGCT